MQGFDLLQTEAAEFLGITLSQEQLNLLNRHADLLAEWNQKFNLTAIRTPEEIRIKHFLDSLSCWTALKERPVSRIIDVGTGAGFPGIPLKVLFPENHLTLVDSVAKKTEFLSLVMQELGLNQVDVLHARAEEIGQNPEYREQFDCALARALAGLPVLVEYLLPLVRVGGCVLAQKGESAAAELADAETAIHLLGGKLSAAIPVTLPGVAEERHLIVIEKIKPTPEKYPRRAGIPSKRPLGA